MTLYKNKYRIESVRLKNWDYSSDGYYYITICVNNRESGLGNINDGQLILSQLGRIAEQCWREIPNHFPFVRLDEFVIMPNHVHGIIIIDKSVETQNLASPQLQHIAPLQLQNSGASAPSKYGPQSKNVGSIIRGFKIGVTKFATNNDIPFKWQPRFYDHIVRNEEDLQRIRNYIYNNPKNWHQDDYFKKYETS